MNATTEPALVAQVAKIFRLACTDKHGEVAEFLLQPLEAIANREGGDAPVELACDELLEHLAGRGMH